MKKFISITVAITLCACATSVRTDDPPLCENDFVFKTVDAGQAYMNYEQGLINNGQFLNLTPLQLNKGFEISYCQLSPTPQDFQWRTFGGTVSPYVRTVGCRLLTPPSPPISRPVTSAANGMKIRYKGCPRGADDNLQVIDGALDL